MSVNALIELLVTSYCSAKWVHIRVASNGRNRGAVVGICGNFRVIIIMVTVDAVALYGIYGNAR